MKFICSLIFLLLLSSVVQGQFYTLDILEDKKKIDIPFEYEQGFIVIKVYLNGVLPLNFIFDTGAENSILLEKEYAHFLGLEMNEKINILGSDKTETMVGYIARSVNLRLQEGAPFNMDLIVLEHQKIDFKNIIGRNIDGIIGGNMLLGAIVDINYKKRYIRFYQPNGWLPPEKYHTEKILVHRQRPFINTEIAIADNSNKSKIKLLMDTGAAIHLMVDEHSHPDLIMPDTIVDGRIGDGLGGQLGGFIGNVSEIDFLEQEFRNIPVYFQKTDTVFTKRIGLHNVRNGIVGNLFLERNRLIIDYPRSTIYIKPYRKKKNPFRFNKSGMIVFAVGPELNEYLVKHIVKHSAADRAGVKVGDIITRINFVPHYFVNIKIINRMLSASEGKKIRIAVKRGNEIKRFKFKLRTNKVPKSVVGE